VQPSRLAAVRLRPEDDLGGSIDGRALDLRQHMRMGVHRQPDLAMAQGLHYRTRRGPGREQERRAGMAQVMKPDRTQPSVIPQCVPRPVDVTRVQGTGRQRGENQAEPCPDCRPLARPVPAAHGEPAAPPVCPWPEPISDRGDRP